MAETKRLHIHSGLAPADAAASASSGASEGSGAGKRTRFSGRRRRRRAAPGDRMLRNTAIACALLLGILALGNVDAPWARKASESVERALSMHIDLDESIGALKFVRELMPESALVFMNLADSQGMVRPVAGDAVHGWSNLQPWLIFSCPDGAEVFAVAQGTVTAVSPLSEGRVGVLVDHGDGVESLYASLTDAAVRQGDSVARGQLLGHAGDSLYFEYRRGGESVDPAPALGL